MNFWTSPWRSSPRSDLMEADTEDLEDGADAEPWLGWTDRGPQASSNMFMDGRGSAYDDREAEDEHGGDINDEPQADDSDDEHSLGWTEVASQTGNLGCYGSEGDLEEDIQDMPHDDDEREPTGEDDPITYGDGSGRAIAETLLKKARAPATPERLKLDPPSIPPLDPDAMDLRAHYWAAKGF
ncbi:hypothetical protein [Mesorhizobium sp. WSM3873]|uniref:hypothetical protein n=1 Tax=Mesorhizobium sp. WSM3873 TaxID=1854056 RepID=UPI0012EAD79C|nr:hypothetical protein [Mesorhizobium sp. WSM3873]